MRVWLCVGALLGALGGGAGCAKGSDGRPADKAAPASGEATEAPIAAAPGAPELAAGSPEALFLAEFSAFASLLSAPGTPAEVVAGVDAYYQAHRARIESIATDLGEKRKTMSDAELRAFEDGLSARPEATAFFAALEAFETRASASEVEQLEAILSAIVAHGDGEDAATP